MPGSPSQGGTEQGPAQGVGNPLEWSVVERCRLLIVLTLPFYVGYALRSAYLIDHPEIEPYFDRGWLVVMRDLIGVLVAFWALFLLWGFVERRRPGRALAEAVVKLHPEASVVFMTGYTDDAVLLRGVFAQEVKLLRKPFPLEALSDAIAEVLGSEER